ncbi:MAG: alpha/beta hydrolase [Dehalococcoidales bacterium]|nr:alpha/beta hydrolase [Dehalococcoidales bacterium]
MNQSAIWSIIGILVLVYVILSTLAAYVLVRIPRLPLRDNPSSIGLEYEDVSFPSRKDKLTLKGWYMPGKKAFTIIVITGMRQNRVDYRINSLNMAKGFVDKGFNVLFFDQRGRGESEGQGIVLTHFERDIGGALDFVRSKKGPDEQIGLIGLSAGAAATVIFSSTENIDAVVADSCFTSITRVFTQKGSAMSKLPRPIVKIFGFGIWMMARIMYGYHRADPADKVANVKCPILFIQGDKDDWVSVDVTERLYKISNNPLDEIWFVPNAGHTKTFGMNPEGYIERITSFFSKFEKTPIENRQPTAVNN